MAAKEMLGVRFDRLLVVERAENARDGTARWRCVCDCGQERVISGTGIRAGRHKSCGCASPRFTAERIATHGMSRSRTYRIWLGMRHRCSDAATGKERKNYFNKGIRVCDRWEKFECFLEDMGTAPDGMSLERRNGNRGYMKSNCTWATPQEQANNTSQNTIVHHDGRSMTIANWAREIGVKPNTLAYRILRGMPVERALQKRVVHIRSQAAMERQRACVVCQKLFIPRTAQLRAGAGKFCSHACQGIARTKR